MKTSVPEVTIILPTTGDRASLAEIALRSVQAQTVDAFEVFIVGDGVEGNSAARLEKLVARDPRVRFLPFPKGRRRGETNRHTILTEAARGRIVAYLTDRDLWLDHHLETLLGALAEADFAHTLALDVIENGTIQISRTLDLHNPRHRKRVAGNWRHEMSVPFSGAAHTLDAYKRLPEGWATTPDDEFTDAHMWRKFFRQPWVRTATCFRPTFLYFWRGGFPGPPVEERATELLHWEDCMKRERTRNFQGFYEAGIKDLYLSHSRRFDETVILRVLRYRQIKGRIHRLYARIFPIHAK